MGRCVNDILLQDLSFPSYLPPPRVVQPSHAARVTKSTLVTWLLSHCRAILMNPYVVLALLVY